MNKILVSGITGFVGGNLKAYLKNKYEVIGISRKANNTQTVIENKEIDNAILNTANAFIHLAGKAHDLLKAASDQEYYDVNTELTKSFFDKFLESECSVFIFMSSVKAVTDKVEDKLTESTKTEPKTIYGKSKLLAEQYILSKKIPENKYVYILRPCMIHGPNNKGNLNLLHRIIKKGIPYPLGAYENKRSFLSVNNLCFAIEKLIKKKPNSGVYNIADNDAISTNELVTIIAETIEKKTNILRVPKLLIHLFAKIGDVLPIPLNTERLEKLTENYIVSNDKIIKAIETDFPSSTKEGIKTTIQSFKQ